MSPLSPLVPARLRFIWPVMRVLIGDSVARLTRDLSAAIPPAGSEPQWLVVTGTGRSGTSAIARVLHESGYAMGTTFDAPDEANPYGYFEDRAMVDINDDILASIGATDLQAARRAPWRSLVLAEAARHSTAMRKLAQPGEFGWKSPAFTLTLESWMRSLRRRPRVVVCLRGPEAYLHSVTAIYGLMSRQAVELAWRSRLERLLDVIDDYRLDVLTIDYDQLIADPNASIARLSKFVGRALNPALVDADLRSHVYRIPKRHRDLYTRIAAQGGIQDVIPALAPAPADRGAIAAYRTAAERIEVALREERDRWEDAVHPDELPLSPAPDLQRLLDVSRVYDERIAAARESLMALAPPDELEAYHEQLRDAIDATRLPAAFILRIDIRAPDPALLVSAASAWRAHCSRPAWERAANARLRALRTDTPPRS